MIKSIKSFAAGLAQAGLRRKILIAIVTIVLILSSVTLLFIDQGVRSQVNKNILTQLDAAATAYIELNDAKLEQVLSRTQFFIQNPVFQRDFRAAPATGPKIAAGFKKITDYDFIMAVNFNGRVLVDSLHPENLGKNVPPQYQEVLQKTVENGRFLGMWSENGKLYQLVALPLLGFDAVLMAGNEVGDKFAYKIDELSRNQITFFSKDKVVASAFSKELAADVEKLIPEIKEKIQRESGEGKGKHSQTFTLKIGGESYLGIAGAIENVPDAGYILASSRDKQLALLYRIEFIIIATGIGGIIFAFVMAIFFSRGLTRSVNHLVKDVEQVKQGNLEHQIVATSKDEIGFLSDMFDSLRIAFRDAQKELKEYAENLEEKVRERTAELSTANSALTAAKDETDRIMNTVGQGLFLVQKEGNEYRIGSQYSKALEEMFASPALGNKDILGVLKRGLPESAMKKTTDYLELMFKPEIKEAVMNNINPLRETEVNFEVAGAAGKQKFLQFKFQRIMAEGAIKHLMATVTDVTKQVLLDRKLKETEEKNAGQMEMLFGILHVEPRMLSEFISDMEEDITLINETLKPGGNNLPLKEKLAIIYRAMHTIKGNASILNLKFFAGKAHEYEEKVGELQQKSDLSGQDFLPLVLKLNEMIETLREVKSLIQRITQFQATFSGEKKNVDLLVRAVDSNVQKLAGELSKKAEFEHDQFDPDVIPTAHRKLMKDILIQLTRNSLSHGIESPSDRKAAGKNESGKITLITRKSANGVELLFRDDGRGLQIDKLRRKAVESGKYKAEEVAKWDAGTVAGVIFIPGISTADQATMNAGRGIGMDIIKEKVQSIGGKVELSFETGKFCEFKIFLPDTAVKK
ncbi:MAG: Hpt domain-containing protein [Leptospiraceae bacterium]|nr:Hpt domain-containing protein [Leptospiraceae bacterium]